MSQLDLRKNVEEKYTWDLSALYDDEAAFEADRDDVQERVKDFVDTYQGRLDKASVIVQALEDYDSIIASMVKVSQYASLPTTVDVTDSESTQRARATSQILARLSAALDFFSIELTQASEETLKEVQDKAPQFQAYLRQVINKKPHTLSGETESALTQLSPVIDGQLDTYETNKLADMDFGTFEVNGEDYPLSYQLYEDHYAYHPDKDIRRAACDAFYQVLEKHKHTVASLYYQEVTKDKTLATLRGYDSVFDYLLASQEVDRDLYNRQIDVIMEDFAPVMRKYAAHLKEVHGLDEITYADLKIDLDPDYALEISVEESKTYISDALSILGEDYRSLLMESYDERWVDFVRNRGKQTGAFCSTAYQEQPFILMTWNNQLSDVYTLAHELGHAGQGIYSDRNNVAITSNMSTYIVEAPSTFHELLLTQSLKEKAQNNRDEHYVYSNMIANTYFHNFVTHLTEAAYQREVYLLIDEGKSFGADELSAIKRQVLEDFWGEDVIINQGAELTWMRQPHYYMGLYPYTYSAGLTIATQAFLNVIEEGQVAVDRWLDFISLGGSLPPVEAAAVAGVDIRTDGPLKATIQMLDETVDRIIELSRFE